MERRLLVKAAQELNDILGLIPQINIKLDDEDLLILIKQASNLIEPDDDLSDSTIQIIKEIHDSNDLDTINITDEVVDDILEKQKTVYRHVTNGRKPGTLSERTLYVYELISLGRYTRQEIIQKCMEKYPDSSKNTWSTVLTNSKNPIYTKFDKLAIQRKEDGVFYFEEEN